MLNGWTHESNVISGRGLQRSLDMDLRVFWAPWPALPFKILLQGKKHLIFSGACSKATALSWNVYGVAWSGSTSAMDNLGEPAANELRGTTTVWQFPLVHKLPTMYKRTQAGADVGMRVVQLKNWLQVKLKIGLYKIDHTCSVTVTHLSLHHSRSMLPAAFYRGKELATISHYVF